MGNDGTPVNRKQFGGVGFNWNQVKSAKVKKENGQKLYFIEFKSGVKVSYPEQKGQAATMSSKEFTLWQSLDYDTETVLNDITGADVAGTEKDDHIIGKNIQQTTIHTDNDNNDDHIDIINDSESMDFIECDTGKKVKRVDTTSSTNKTSYGNTLMLGKDDTATYKSVHTHLGNGKSVKETIHREVKGEGIENRF